MSKESSRLENILARRQWVTGQMCLSYAHPEDQLLWVSAEIICCRSVHTAESALGSATALLRDARQLALDDFTKTLRQHAGVPPTDALLFGAAPSSVGGDSAATPKVPTTPYAQSRLGAPKLTCPPKYVKGD